jgi:hypothetical protein
MRNLFRRITVFICSFFWSNKIRPCNPIRFIRKYWAQLALSSIAIQAIACAYGGEDGYGGQIYLCKPLFTLQKKSDKSYSNCEQDIVDQLVIAKDIQDNFNKSSSATIEAWNEAIANAREIAVTCDMKHLKADSTLTSYICPDGRTRTVEEGEQYNSYR